MKKLTLSILFACASTLAFAQQPPADKPEGGSMPDRPEKAEGGTMSGKAEGGELPGKPADGTMPGKPEGGTMNATFAPNASCSVEGTWHALGGKTEANPNGMTMTSSFAGGTYTTQTPNGQRTSSYSVVGTNVTFSKGDLVKAPKGAKGADKKANTCDASSTATYEAQFTGDCGSLKLVTTSDSCAQRARVIQANTWHRNAKPQ